MRPATVITRPRRLWHRGVTTAAGIISSAGVVDRELGAVACSRRPFSSSSSGSSSAKRRDRADHDHCVSLVEERDREGYLCGLLLPGNSARQKETYFATRAFNVELASVKDGTDPRRRPGVMSEAVGGGNLPAKMRMQWWREALDEVYSTTTDGDDDGRDRVNEAAMHQPVVRALRRAVVHHQHSQGGGEEGGVGLTRRFLERMVDARDADLDVGQYETVQELVDYAEDTAGSLLYLSLEGAGVRDATADLTASHIGVASGIVTALRSTAYRASQRGELAIPAELMRRHSVPSTYLLSPTERPPGEGLSGTDREADEALRAAVSDLALVARAHLSQARDMQGNVPTAGRACLLPAVGALYYLEQLEKVGYDVLHPTLNIGQVGTLAVPLLLGRAWLTGFF